MRIAAKLAKDSFVGAAAGAAFGDQQAGGGGDDQCRDLADKAVAYSQHRVGRGGIGETEVILCHANDNAANDIDDGDQQARYGVPADKF